MKEWSLEFADPRYRMATGWISLSARSSLEGALRAMVRESKKDSSRMREFRIRNVATGEIIPEAAIQ